MDDDGDLLDDLIGDNTIFEELDEVEIEAPVELSECNDSALIRKADLSKVVKEIQGKKENEEKPGRVNAVSRPRTSYEDRMYYNEREDRRNYQPYGKWEGGKDRRQGEYRISSRHNISSGFQRYDEARRHKIQEKNRSSSNMNFRRHDELEKRAIFNRSSDIQQGNYWKQNIEGNISPFKTTAETMKVDRSSEFRSRPIEKRKSALQRLGGRELSTEEMESNISNDGISSGLRGDRACTTKESKIKQNDKLKLKKHDQMKTLKKDNPKPTRYFLIKCDGEKNIAISKKRGNWSTVSKNDKILNAAFRHSEKVVLFFTVNNSEGFEGYAHMTSEVQKRRTPWAGKGGTIYSDSVFEVKWLDVRGVLFKDIETMNLKNNLNCGKPIKFGRDGQEIDTRNGAKLVKILEERNKSDPTDSDIKLSESLKGASVPKSSRSSSKFSNDNLKLEEKKSNFTSPLISNDSFSLAKKNISSISISRKRVSEASRFPDNDDIKEQPRKRNCSTTREIWKCGPLSPPKSILDDKKEKNTGSLSYSYRSSSPRRSDGVSHKFSRYNDFHNKNVQRNSNWSEPNHVAQKMNKEFMSYQKHLERDEVGQSLVQEKYRSFESIGRDDKIKNHNWNRGSYERTDRR